MSARSSPACGRESGVFSILTASSGRRRNGEFASMVSPVSNAFGGGGGGVGLDCAGADVLPTAFGAGCDVHADAARHTATAIVDQTFSRTTRSPSSGLDRACTLILACAPRRHDPLLNEGATPYQLVHAFSWNCRV